MGPWTMDGSWHLAGMALAMGTFWFAVLAILGALIWRSGRSSGAPESSDDRSDRTSAPGRIRTASDGHDPQTGA